MSLLLAVLYLVFTPWVERTGSPLFADREKASSVIRFSWPEKHEYIMTMAGCADTQHRHLNTPTFGEAGMSGQRVFRTLEIGKRYGRLVVTGEGVHPGNRKRYYTLTCDCGNTLSCGATVVALGMRVSCGCYGREAASKRMALRNFKHGHAPNDNTSKAYRTYHGMHSRCNNPKYSSYYRYGGRGIMVCERWSGHNGFANFLTDMGTPSNGAFIDRIDNDGNYEPSNCRWVSLVESNRNRSNVKKITFNGRTQLLTDWAKEIGIEAGSLSRRLKKGWPIERAMTEPVQPARGPRLLRRRANVLAVAS